MARTFRVSVKDEKGEPMPFAAVFASNANGVPDGSGSGANTDVNGVSVFTGDPTFITARFVGYTTQVASAKHNLLEFTLVPSVTRLKTVEITAERKKASKPVNVKKVVGWGLGILAVGTLLAVAVSEDGKE